MDFQQLKDLVLQGLAVGMVGWFAYEMRKMRESVESLNIKIAVVIRDVDNHEHRLNRLEEKNGK
jgi:hypothetical protein